MNPRSQYLGAKKSEFPPFGRRLASLIHKIWIPPSNMRSMETRNPFKFAAWSHTCFNKSSFSAISSSVNGSASSIFFCSSFRTLSASAPRSGFFGTYRYQQLVISCPVFLFYSIHNLSQDPIRYKYFAIAIFILYFCQSPHEESDLLWIPEIVRKREIMKQQQVLKI